jgi:hypothetical protein
MNQGPYGPTPPPMGPGGPPNQLGPSGYGPPPSQYGPPPDDNMAWAGIGLSSLGWVSCCCGFVPFVGIFGALGGLLFSIGGIVCGYLALQKAKQFNTRTDLAMIGIVLGAVRLGLMLLFIVLGVVLLVAGVGVGFLEQYTHPH